MRMLINIINSFRLYNEKEDPDTVIDIIHKGVLFRGTNLWILVFAIFIASLGLNINSSAVIIGAMLVSPLMGPIMGLGMGMAINDVELLKKALYNYLFAAGVSLAASTIYFLISPINDAHSEILARTSPTVYDVMIAFFGGLAGVLATSSKQKGNVIPGVAIATALMPPLCTAGYGLATLQLNFFIGAFYLFLINTVFIALATLITARVLKFPLIRLPDKKTERKARNIIAAVVIVTLLPSIYFAFDIIRQERLLSSINSFIEKEAVIAENYLLNKQINLKEKKITLIFGGKKIEENEVRFLKEKLPKYNLNEVTLEIKQGFAYFDKASDEETNKFNAILNEKENTIRYLKNKIDSIDNNRIISKHLLSELQVQYNQISSIIMQPGYCITDSSEIKVTTVIIQSTKNVSNSEREKITSWLPIRLDADSVVVLFTEK